MSYLVPFAVLQKQIPQQSSRAGNALQLPYDDLVEIIKTIIRVTPVDEEWYLRTYPDVAAAIAAGQMRSAKQHFVENGYFEGRRPFVPQVDETWYLAQYPDVAEGVELGDFASAQDHFVLYGYDEGRLPRED